MPSDFLSLTKTQFAQASDPKIYLNNLNRTPFAESLASHSVPQLSGSTKATQLFLLLLYGNRGNSFTRESYLLRPTSRTLTTRLVVP